MFHGGIQVWIQEGKCALPGREFHHIPYSYLALVSSSVHVAPQTDWRRGGGVGRGIRGVCGCMIVCVCEH